MNPGMQRLHDSLAAHDCRPRLRHNGFDALCPAHDDRKASLSASEGEQQNVVLCCHAGCRAEEVLGAIGLSWPDVMETRSFAGTRPRTKIESASRPRPAKCNVGDRYNGERITHVYDYRDASGNVVYRVCRTRGKQFPVARKDANSPTGWYWGLGDTPRVLYGLPAVLEAIRNGCIIYVVEGEKDADALNSAFPDRTDFCATCNPGGAGTWQPQYSETLSGAEHIVIVADKDGDEVGLKHARDIAESLHGKVKQLQIVRAREGKDTSDHLEAGFGLEDFETVSLRMLDSAVAEPESSSESLPEILTNGTLKEITDAAEQALVRRPDLGVYSRGNALVRVLRDPADSIKWLIRPKGSPTISPASLVWLREQLDQAAQWITPAGTKRTHPPKDVVQTMACRAGWTLRMLEGIVECPVFLPNGQVLSSPGYDTATGLLYEPGDISYPRVPEEPTRDEVQNAVKTLLDPFKEFPFLADADRSVVFANILTLMTRSAIRGPCPVFSYGSPTPGSGKGLCADAVATIATGREAPRMTLPGSDDESRKRILALAMEGTPLVLIDNAISPFGSQSLAAALTATTWSDRVLGVSETRTAPLRAVWMITGNNLQFRRDVGRRVIPCDLDPKCEHPEDRIGFRYPSLLEHIRNQRPSLVAAALTVLRGFHVAGRPSHANPPKGSFEEWDALIRGAVIWVGLDDPVATVQRIRSEGDAELEQLRRGLDTWYEVFGTESKSAAEAMQTARSRPSLLEELAAFCLCDPRHLNGHKLGTTLRRFKGRLCDERRFVTAAQDRRKKVQRWQIDVVVQSLDGSCG